MPRVTSCGAGQPQAAPSPVSPLPLTLSQGQAPLLAFEDKERERQVQLWQINDLRFSDEYLKPVSVVRSVERWTETRIEGGKKVKEARQSQWLWVVHGERAECYGAQVAYHGGHRRWGIENKAFNELTQAYHLEHCYHHEPTSMLAQMLILMLGFTLFTAFAKLHNQLVRLGQLSMKALAHNLDLALEEDLPWDQWFQCG